MENSTTEDLARKQKIHQIKTSRPIFIIGSQRSGTSFLYRLIQKHLKIGFGRDNGNFVRFLKLLPYYEPLENEANLRKLIKDIIAIPEFKKRFKGFQIDIDDFIQNLEERSYREVVREFYAEWACHNAMIRWGGKTPDYSLHAKTLYELFPDAKFIHIIRDGRDVALSLFNLDWGAKDSLIAAKHWEERVASALAFGKQLDAGTYMEMRYEQLVQYPEKEFERLIHFIEYEEDRTKIIEDFKRETSPIVKRDNFDKWRTKLSKRQIKTFEHVGGKLLQELSYEVVFPEVIDRKVILPKLLWHHFNNIIKKLAKGEGFKGVYVKGRRVLNESVIKINSMFKKS